MSVAFVTGSSRGIGRAIALRLAEAGWDVALTARSADALAETAAAAAGHGVTAVPVPADLSSWEATERACTAAVEALGVPDLVVNNAGYAAPDVSFLDSDPASFERVVAVNLLGPIWVCRALLPAMVARGSGVVVNVNSLGGTRPFPHALAYAASKAGLCRVTDTLAAELDGAVQLFDVSPGLVRTDMTAEMAMWRDVPDDVWSPPSAIADTVLALASGDYAALSGRFVHAPRDDLSALAEGLGTEEARTLRLVPYGPDDPLAG